MTIQAYAAHKADGKLESFEYELGSLKPDEVEVDIEQSIYWVKSVAKESSQIPRTLIMKKRDKKIFSLTGITNMLL
jgi:hypothetical protein